MSDKKKDFRLKNCGRRYSEPLRRHVVDKIKSGAFTVPQASLMWGMDTQTLYKWLHDSGVPKGAKIVLEMETEGKKFANMQSRITALEAALGRKQMELDYLNKLIDLTGEELGVDIRKKGFTPPSTGSDPNVDPTPTK